MKRSLLALMILTVSGCATEQQVWKLLPTETAQVDYVGIIPLHKPESGAVARFSAELRGMRKYEFSLAEGEVDREIRRLLDGNRTCQLQVHNGVFTLVPPEGGKILLGGSGDARPAPPAFRAETSAAPAQR